MLSPLPLLFCDFICAGHGKTYLSRNAASSLVGQDNFFYYQCDAVKDKADLWGSRLGGFGAGAGLSSTGALTEFLRPRQGKDTVIFLDEVDKMKGLSSSLGWDQAKDIFKTFLTPWESGLLTDNSATVRAGASNSTIDCSRVVWVLTANWGKELIKRFADTNHDRIYSNIGPEDATWLKTELVDKILKPEVTTELKGVGQGIDALVSHRAGVAY